MVVTYKATSGVNQRVFERAYGKPQIFLARAFGARDVFTVILLGMRAKTTIRELVRLLRFQFAATFVNGGHS